jgi:alkylated DNA nucleotide flippase Atl1
MTKIPSHGDHATPDREPTFADRVRAVVAGLQPGEVVTYGEVAAEVGAPGSARAVGRLLSTDGGGDLPWWRVVTSTGRLVPGHESRHARLLGAEGVRVTRGRVDLRRR